MGLEGLYGAVPLSHYFLRERLREGDRAVDATCGNGQDTLLLAELVGGAGMVWAFDIQAEALATTAGKLAAAGLADRVQLVPAGHETMGASVPAAVRAIVFNLGYLPTGEHGIKTSAVTTVAALQQGKGLLLPGGIILIGVYTGHDGGGEEWAAVRGWLERLSPLEFNVWQSRQLNRSEKAPFLAVVEKMP